MLGDCKCYDRDCVYYEGIRWLGDTEETEAHTCKAFPEGIPKEIASGDNLHLEPYPGDHSIQFEEKL